MVHALGDTRLSLNEMNTLLLEILNLVNERPIIGLKPNSRTASDYLSPKSLLLGRSSVHSRPVLEGLVKSILSNTASKTEVACGQAEYDGATEHFLDNKGNSVWEWTILLVVQVGMPNITILFFNNFIFIFVRRGQSVLDGT